MQKLKLLKNLKSSQFLSKDQLRSVTGGAGMCYCLYGYPTPAGGYNQYIGSMSESACSGSSGPTSSCFWVGN